MDFAPSGREAKECFVEALGFFVLRASFWMRSLLPRQGEEVSSGPGLAKYVIGAPPGAVGKGQY